MLELAGKIALVFFVAIFFRIDLATLGVSLDSKRDNDDDWPTFGMGV